MKILIGVLFALIASSAVAGDVVISIGSKHINSDYEFNEINLGAGYIVDMNRVIYKYAPDYFTYGAYYNSIKKVSAYALAGYMVSNNLSFEVGPVTGYDPSVMISVTGVIHMGSVRIIVVPPVPSRDIPLVLGLQIRI